MPEFGDLPLAILRSVSAVSGENYYDVHEPELREELNRRGYEPGHAALNGVMRQLTGAGYLECTFTGGEVALIRLREKGRQEVEGWPTTPGSISAAEVKQLVASLEARAEDPTLDSDEQSKARAAAGALQQMGISVTSTLLAAWLRHLGVP